MKIDSKQILDSYLKDVTKVFEKRTKNFNTEECVNLICDRFEFEIDRDKVLSYYKEKMDILIEECDWITHIEPETAVYWICQILKEHPEIIKQ